MKINEKLFTKIGTGTRASALTNGVCTYYKVGNVVTAIIGDLYGNSTQITGDGTMLITNLPKAKSTKVFILQSYSTFEQVRVRITTSGQICLHYSSLPVTSTSKQFYGTITYETTD